MYCQLDVMAQESGKISTQSINGEELLNVDSLAFKDKLGSSYFYIYSKDNVAYSGKAITFYGDKALDSLNILEGYKNGWQRLYFIQNGNETLGKLEYFGQNEIIYISNVINSKFKKKSAFASFRDANDRYFYEIIYKPRNKIIVKESIKSGGNSKKKRYKYSSFSELESFIKRHNQIYPFCKQAGFFDSY
jgi:hypothetical protein